MEWIKCNERMPEDSVFVLIFDGKEQCVARLNAGSWYMNDMGAEWINGLYVTHWMPLPEIPNKNIL